MILDAGVFIALENPAQRGVVLALITRMRDDVVDAGLAVLSAQLDMTILTTYPADMTRLGAANVALLEPHAGEPLQINGC